MDVIWGARRGDRVLAVDVPREQRAHRDLPGSEWWPSDFVRFYDAGWVPVSRARPPLLPWLVLLAAVLVSSALTVADVLVVVGVLGERWLAPLPFIAPTLLAISLGLGIFAVRRL